MRRVIVLAVALFSATSTQGQPAPTNARQLRFGSPTRLLPDIELNALGDVAFGPNGRIYVLDASNHHVYALDSLGRITWRAGGKGPGPGEFRLPVRIAARPTGGVAVFDWGNGRMTLLSSTGKAEAAMQVPLTFTQIDGMAILPDGRFVIAAVTNWRGDGGAAAGHSIHVLDDSLAYRSSFGSHAVALDTAAVRYVGSGGFTMNGKGQILFTPKRPFEVHRYTTNGRLVDRTSVGAPMKHELGDFIAVQQSGGQTFKGTTAKTKFVELPTPVTELDEGGFITGRHSLETTTVDLISSTGVLEASARAPAGCIEILGVDAGRRQLYCKALRNDEPVLLRVPFSIGPNRR